MGAFGAGDWRRYGSTKMKITEIDKNNIHKIKDLWEELNAHHCEKSSHFKFHFESFSFEKRIEGLLDKEHLVIYAVEIKSSLVGYCIATVNGRNGEIDSLYIKKEYRGDGLGNKLTEKALAWIDKLGCNEVKVYIAEGNESSLPFYERFGFRERFRVLQIKKP